MQLKIPVIANRFNAVNSSIPINIEIGQLIPSQSLANTGYLLSLGKSEGKWTVTERVGHPGHELGFGNWVETITGKIFACYFATTRSSDEHAPDYRGGLYLYIDGVIFPVDKKSTEFKFSSGVWNRKFIAKGGNITKTVEYKWPFYKDLFSSGIHVSEDYESTDFFFVFIKNFL